MASFKVKEVHWEIFYDFFVAHPDFVTGKLNNAFGRDKLKKLWEDLTVRLNAAGYGEKSTEKWQKTWSDYKCSLKKKASDIKRSKEQTGGGPETDKKLTELELKFLSILGETFYRGIAVSERGPFSNDKQTLMASAEPSSSEIMEEYATTVPSRSIGVKRPAHNDSTEEFQSVLLDHDYNFLNSTPSSTKKKKLNRDRSELDNVCLESVKILSEINIKLGEINQNMKDVANSINKYSDAVATGAQNITDALTKICNKNT